MIPKVASWKPDRVTELRDIVSKEGIVGVVDNGFAGVNLLPVRRAGQTGSECKHHIAAG